jgi:pre-mRNA-splicing factor RBM22/SLT11
LEKLARVRPSYAKNDPHVCSFFVKGICARGNACPYKHELPKISDLSDQNIEDRYFGTKDPLAKKIMREYYDTKVPNIPLDKTVTTLYIGGFIDDSFKEKDFK